MMDDLYMMMGDDPSVYLSPPDAQLPASLIDDDDDDDDDSEEDDFIIRRSSSHYHRSSGSSNSGISSDDVINTNSTNQMLDVVNNKRQQQQQQQRKGNRRQNNNNNNRNRNRNNNNQNDGASSYDDNNNPINVISAFNRTGKIYNKLRKNDAVKVIDTPSGRAGFVYQSGTNNGGSSSSSSSSSSSNNNQGFPLSTSIKESNSNNNNNWNDDSYSQNQYVNRNANDVKLIPSDDTSNKKILPVLTSDGKIALVVRGDTSRYFDENQNNGSGNSINTKKYEPITNLTSIITALNSNNDNNNNNNNNKHNDSINLGDGSSSSSMTDLKSIQEQNRLINRLDEFFASVTNKVKHIEEEIEHKLGIDLEESGTDDGRENDDDGFHIDQASATMTTTTTIEPYFDEDRKDTLLINRPLSEVLGLPRKTHYHYPHDPLHTSSTSEVPASPTTRHHENTRRIKADGSLTLTTTTTDSSQVEEFDLESPEKINIAVIPRFDSELEERLFGKNRDNANRNYNNEVSHTSGAMSSIHCAMQVIIGVACACTLFGVVGAYYRIEIVNQIRVVYW